VGEHHAAASSWLTPHPSKKLFCLCACAVVLLAAVGLWVVQEHAIHKYLLHSGFQWIGKRWVGWHQWLNPMRCGAVVMAIK
jgi:hypothetical protein